MDHMRIRTGNDFAMTPDQALAMLADPVFWRAVALLSHPVEFQVDADDARVRTRRTLHSDPSIVSVTGPVITIVDEIAWEDRDGEVRVGQASAHVEGLPATMAGTVRLHPGGRGTLLDYDGELAIRVPLFGSVLERRAAPVLKEAIVLQQQVADAWQARPSQ